MNAIQRAAVRVLLALRAQLAKVDPKVLQVPITAAITYVVAHIGLDVDDPTVLLAIGIAASTIIGALVPNAATGLDDRWTPPDR